MIKEILERLYHGEVLSQTETNQLMHHIADGNASDVQIAALLSAYNMRPIAVEEFAGFRTALLELAFPLDIGDGDYMDLCGTGGDGKDTFNVSTLSSFVAAGAGVPVAKHGNNSVSSTCGSSNVLEALGVSFSADSSVLRKRLDDSGICFLHAPLFHPAMKHVGPARAQLGVKTVFNMLGPLVNPARPKYQISGVFSAAVARLYYYLLLETDIRFAVVYDLQGYDEISLTGPVKIYTREGEQVLQPEAFGLNRTEASELYGGDDVDAATDIFKNVIEGRGTQAQQDVVCANAGLAIAVYKGILLKEGVSQAQVSLEEGKARAVLQNVTNR